MKEAEQELERERNAVQQRQEDEQLALKVQNPGLVVDYNQVLGGPLLSIPVVNDGGSQPHHLEHGGGLSHLYVL